MTDTIHPTSLALAIAEVRALLNEPTASFWTDAEITSWIKESAVQISSISLCVEAMDTITLATATMVYASLDTSSSDVPEILRVFAAMYDDGASPEEYTGLQKIHPRQLKHLANMEDGPPQYYWHFAENIGFYPMPTSDENSKNVHIYYSKVTDDITALPDVFQPLAILYATGKAFMKDKKFTVANQYMSAYINQLNFLRQDWFEAEKQQIDSKDMQKTPDRSVVVGQ